MALYNTGATYALIAPVLFHIKVNVKKIFYFSVEWFLHKWR